MNLLPPKLHLIGKIVSKHGYKGNIIVRWDDEDLIPEIGDTLFVVIDGIGVPFLIEEQNSTQEILTLHTVNNETFAQELVHCEVAIEADFVEETNDFSFVGFTILNAQNESIGVISSIEAYPGQLMITVSSENRDFLIPYVETWIRDVNENSRTLTMDLPEGIIDPENHED